MSGGVVLIALVAAAGLALAAGGVHVGRAAEDEQSTRRAGRRTGIALVVAGAFLLAVAAVLVLLVGFLHAVDPSFYGELG